MVPRMVKTAPTGGGPGTNQYRIRGVSRARHRHRPQPAARTHHQVRAAAASFSEVTFDDDDLRGALLAGRNLVGTQFLFTDARNADFRGSDLRGAYFFGTHLDGADLRGADLRGAKFIDCSTTDIILDGARYDDRTSLHPHGRSKTEAGMVPYLDSTEP